MKSTLSFICSPGGVLSVFRTLLLLGVVLVFPSLATAQYAYVVPLTQSVVDNATLNLPPGSVIGIQAGNRGRLVLQNFHGAPGQRFVFKNKDGKVRIRHPIGPADAMDINNCSEFELRGDGVPGIKYGFEIYESYGPASLGIGALSTNYEICFIECHHNYSFSGITAKTDPGANGYAVRGNFTQYDTKIHDCYVHDVKGEGFYIGNSYYSAGMPPNGYLPHEIHGLRLYNNITLRTGREGIQVGCAAADAEIYNNVVIESGITNELYQRNAVQLGGGTTGKFYNNILIGAPTNGMSLGTIGNNTISNNIIADMGESAIFSEFDTTTSIVGSYMRYYNNTIINPGKSGLLCYGESFVNEFKNNIVVAPNTAYNMVDVDTGVTVIQANNVFQRDMTGLAFVNPTADDYRIGSTSTAANVGANLAGGGVTSDFEGLARPFGAAYDAGAHEVGALSSKLYWGHPTGYGVNDGMLVVSALGGLPPYTYAWGDGPTMSARTGLAPGNYSVTVTDSAAATRSLSFTLVEPDLLHATARVIPKTGGLSNGMIYLDAHGGTLLHTIVWADAPAHGYPSYRNGLNSGTYNYTLTDSMSNTSSGSVYVRDAGTPIYRVNCGGPQLTDAVLNWHSDTRSLNAPPASPYFAMTPLSQQNGTGGSTGYSGVNQTEAISGIFGSRRVAVGVDMQYAFPVTNGSYEVQLYFMEYDAAIAVGQRVFDIALEGVTQVAGFDAMAVAGPNVPIQRNFIVNVTDGMLNLLLHRITGNVAISGIAVHTPAVLPDTVVTPLAWGSATGSGACPATGTFNEQPTWDAVLHQPTGVSPTPHSGTGTAYANRFWYIDFGTNFAKVRITSMWTRYRPSTVGSFAGFAAMWWDDDKDTINDGISAPTLNFNSGQNVLTNTTQQTWVRDVDLSLAPVTPQGRYLVVSTGAAPTDRANEFVFIGYTLP